MVDQLSQRSSVEASRLPDYEQASAPDASFEQIENTSADAVEQSRFETVQGNGVEEKQHLQALRQGPLAATPVPTGPVPPKDLEEIKKILFPKIDFTKDNPTPEQLVMALLLEHNMNTELAHDWVEFLAQSNHSSIESAA